VRDLTEIVECGEVASNQLPYSLMFRAIEYEILPLCLEKNIGVLCYSTLLHGLLAGKFATLADVPDGRARTRHFSKNRPNTRHNEDGCEAEVSIALERIRHTAEDHQIPMQLLAVSWVLQQPGVAAVILGARKPEQIQQMVNGTETHLHQETLRKLNAITEQTKQCLGPNPDMWMSESRFR
jgi:aryl-alcohol dehydrogenase-like predicted oxidoreductase